jgi:hypothetical protein
MTTAQEDHTMTDLAIVEDRDTETTTLGETEARALTERIRTHWNIIKAPLQAFAALMAEAEEGRPWEALNHGTGETGRMRWLREEFGIGRAQYFRKLKAAGDEALLSEAAGVPLQIPESRVRGLGKHQIGEIAAAVTEKIGDDDLTHDERMEIVQAGLAEARAASPVGKPRRYAENEVVDAEVTPVIVEPRTIPDGEPEPAAVTRPAPKGRRISDESVAHLAKALDMLAGVGVHAEDMARGLTAKQAAELPSLEDAYEWLTVFYAARASV